MVDLIFIILCLWGEGSLVMVVVNFYNVILVIS